MMARTSKIIRWNELFEMATKSKYGRRIKVIVSDSQSEYEKEILVKALTSTSRIIAIQEPQVVSKNAVDVNEKEYVNEATQPERQFHDTNADSSTIKIVKYVENTQGHNYVQTTTNGLEFGASVNSGLKFGLPQFGVNLDAGGHINRNMSETTQQAINSKRKVGTEAHHEETVEIQPGEKILVKMTSYKVRYLMQYTIEYGIEKNLELAVTYTSLCDQVLNWLVYTIVILFLLLCPLMICLCFKYVSSCCSKKMVPIKVTSRGRLTTKELLQSLPTYREDDDKVYFTQEGVLRWIANRVESSKDVITE